MISVGKVLKAHGVHGEIKAECYTDTPSCLVRCKRLFIDKKEYAVVKSRIQGDFLLIKFKNVDDMDSAERLRNQEIFAEKSDMPKLPQGRYYIGDLVGSSVILSDRIIGKLVDVLQYGAADVFVMRSVEGKEIMFPYVGEVIHSIDLEKQQIFLNKEEWERVAVYED
ncbi:MAG: 16S rRNA processing protein RimM [Clostridia bacterium]|nr:16S rRNA processing protein RimM [Clostridia bacterium]